MTGPQPNQASGRNRRMILWLGAGMFIGAAIVAGYFVTRPKTPLVPPINMEGCDPEVVSLIEASRVEVEQDPQSAAAWGKLGIVLFAQSMYADCVPIFERAEQLDDGDSRWPYYRGLALILAKPDQGIAALELAVQISPRSTTLRLRLAEEYIKLDRMDQAEPLFRQLSVEDPDNARALLGLGQILLRHGKPEEALVPLRRAAKHPTAQRSARVELSQAYFRLGNIGAAEAESKSLADGPPDVAWPDEHLQAAAQYRKGLQPQVDQVLQFIRNDRLDLAGPLADQLVRDYPNSDEAHLTRAKVAVRLANSQLAIDELRKAIRLNEGLIEGHFLIGCELAKKADYESAARSFARTAELKPSHGIAHFNLGTCRRILGDRSRAIESFQNAIRARPDLSEAHLALGELYFEDGKYGDAFSHLETAMRMGDNPRARELLEKIRSKKSP